MTESASRPSSSSSPARPRSRSTSTSVYVQDTFTDAQPDRRRRPALRQPGGRARPDDSFAAHPAAARPAAGDRPCRAAAARSSGAASRPRVGLTYGIGEKHATLLRASWSRFADQMGTAMFADAIATPGSSLLSRSPRCASSIVDGDRRGRSQRDAVSDPPGTLGGTVLDPALEAPLTDEILFGAEHAGVGCFSIGGRLPGGGATATCSTRRPFVRDGSGAVRVATRDDYVPDTFATGSLPDGSSVLGARSSRCVPSSRSTGTQRLANGGREVELPTAPRSGSSAACATAGSSAPTPTSATRTRRSARSSSRSTIPPTRSASTTTTAPRSRPESVFADQSGVYLHSRWDYTIAGLYRARGRHRARAARARARGLSAPLLRGRRSAATA